MSVGKDTGMLINLNEFLISISFALDFLEMDLLNNSSNHSKRVAYISHRLGKEMGLTEKERFDLISLSVMHDNGIIGGDGKAIQKTDIRDIRLGQEGLIDHCLIGEKNIIDFPFYTNIKDVLLYHHENYDGSGFFGKTFHEVPLMSQIIRLADGIDNFTYTNQIDCLNEKVKAFAEMMRDTVVSSRLVDLFYKVASNIGFWLDLKTEYIENALKSSIPNLVHNLPMEKIYDITKVYSRLIDCKSKFTFSHSSGLAKKAEKMADFYQMNYEMKYKLIIAARLHDIGKLAISNDILDKPGKLTEEEYEEMKRHVYYTRISLSRITGFEDITNWAANHHEKLDGSGYPYGLTARDLDFNSRLMGVLDIFQALTEERPYRHPASKEKVSEILWQMAENKKLDRVIVEDVLKVLIE